MSSAALACCALVVILCDRCPSLPFLVMRLSLTLRMFATSSFLMFLELPLALRDMVTFSMEFVWGGLMASAALACCALVVSLCDRCPSLSFLVMRPFLTLRPLAVLLILAREEVPLDPRLETVLLTGFAWAGLKGRVVPSCCTLADLLRERASSSTASTASASTPAVGAGGLGDSSHDAGVKTDHCDSGVSRTMIK